MMQVPFNHLGRLAERDGAELETALLAVVKGGRYLFGPQARCLEQKIAGLLGVNPGHVVSCGSGTDALLLSLLAAGVRGGDEVVVPVNTAIPTAAAVALAGATPVFCDVDPHTWLAGPSEMERVITPRTRAVIPVHLHGNVADIPGIRRMLLRHGAIFIIEDVAQAQGASWAGKAAGSMGDFGAFSFYPTKNLGALGDGGCLVTRQEAGAERARALAFYGQPVRGEAVIPRGTNSRLDELQAAALNLRILRLAGDQRRKQVLREHYMSALHSLPLMFQEVGVEAAPAWNLFCVKTKTPRERDELRAHLEARGVATLIHYSRPLHQQPAFAGGLESYPVAEHLSRTILSLPFGACHTEEEISYVGRLIGEFFRGRRRASLPDSQVYAPSTP